LIAKVALVKPAGRGPIGLFVSSIDRPGTPAFHVVDVNGLITPSADELFEKASPAFLQGFDAEREMIAIAEKQRLIEEPGRYFNEDHSSVAGSHRKAN
jgi:hypothetical protein